MPKIAYETKKFSKTSQAIITVSNNIIREYQSQGFVLTLRQLYYQLVARDYIPNKQNEYDRLSRVITDARRCGMVDWTAIIDRTRNLKSNSHWNSPSHIIKECSKEYLIDMWKNQKYRVEVWVEKDAAIGVVDGVCRALDVPYFSCRGYTSDSEIWAAAQRIIERAEYNRQATIILHFGDHDPSGIDMSRDIKDRLLLFTKGKKIFKVVRLALNMDQIKEYNPPPNPAKKVDPRFKDYQEKYGDESWELDALEPKVIAELIKTGVNQLVDKDKWRDNELRVIEDRELLKKVGKKWDKIVEVL